MQKLIIKSWLPDLNTYINLERSNKFAGAAYKKQWTLIAMREAQVQRLTLVGGRVDLIFSWYMTNKRKDPDNISFGAKFCLDGLVLAGVLKNDGWNNINTIAHDFHLTDKKAPFVEVLIIPEPQK